MSVPRVLIAGLRGGGGKTLISLGLLAAWRRAGCNVAPYKKGPDYIDAAWLSKAAGTPCRNLDMYLMPPEAVVRSFTDTVAGAEVAVIEGNRGLFDGMDAAGSYSTAELAKLLQAPVVLTVDCTKATRTVAALVLGCQQLDQEVDIAGVILNRVAGARHERVLRDAIGQVCNVPVLGVIPKLSDELFPERHLGLVPPQEHDHETRVMARVGDVAERYLDLSALRAIARAAPGLAPPPGPLAVPTSPTAQVRIGVFRDAAFQFYYPENLEALGRAGAQLIEISPMQDGGLPDVDALYIGGGFPETLAPALADNMPFRDAVRRTVDAGLPVYAECGGAVYLGETLLFEGQEFPMAGVLPVTYAFSAKPQGHGYVELETVAENPFLPVGSVIRGHEFHYTYLESSDSRDLTFAFRVRRGRGFDGDHDGLCHGNVLACYAHVHALGTSQWAPALARAAARFQARTPRQAGVGTSP